MRMGASADAGNSLASECIQANSRRRLLPDEVSEVRLVGISIEIACRKQAYRES
jgi:hypothetical protein